MQHGTPLVSSNLVQFDFSCAHAQSHRGDSLTVHSRWSHTRSGGKDRDDGGERREYRWVAGPEGFRRQHRII